MRRDNEASTTPGTAPRPLVCFRRLCDPAENAEQKCAGPAGRVGDGHVGRGKPLRQSEPLVGPQRLVDQLHHGADYLRRGVVGARLLAEVVVVNAQEFLIEVEPRFRVSLADGGPVDSVKHARERGERRLQCCLVVGIVGEKAKRRTDQRVGLAQLLGDPVETVGEVDVTRPRHQQAKRDRLRVAIRKRFIRRAREQKFPPVLREVRERSRPLLQLLHHLFAKQPAEAGSDISELRSRAGWLRFPLKEVGEQRHEAVRCGKLVASCRDIALQVNDLPLELAAPP